MNGKAWVILGYVAIISGKMIPVFMAAQTSENIQFNGPFGGSASQFSQTIKNLALINAIGEIFFWGGIIAAVFGFIKYYKEN